MSDRRYYIRCHPSLLPAVAGYQSVAFLSCGANRTLEIVSVAAHPELLTQEDAGELLLEVDCLPEFANTSVPRFRLRTPQTIPLTRTTFNANRFSVPATELVVRESAMWQTSAETREAAFAI